MAMVAGALVAAGSLNAYAAGVLLVLADLVGDALYYSLGRFGHAPLLQRVSDRLSLHPERFKSLEQKFHDHDWKLILIGKTQAFGSIILYFAGASRMSFVRYLAVNLLGTVPKVLHSTRYIDYVTVAMFAIALVLIASYLLVRRYLSRDLMQDT
jgi:membrane-associated protein